MTVKKVTKKAIKKSVPKKPTVINTEAKVPKIPLQKKNDNITKKIEEISKISNQRLEKELSSIRDVINKLSSNIEDIDKYNTEIEKINNKITSLSKTVAKDEKDLDGFEIDKKVQKVVVSTKPKNERSVSFSLEYKLLDGRRTITVGATRPIKKSDNMQEEHKKLYLELIESLNSILPPQK